MAPGPAEGSADPPGLGVSVDGSADGSDDAVAGLPDSVGAAGDAGVRSGDPVAVALPQAATQEARHDQDDRQAPARTERRSGVERSMIGASRSES